MTLFSWFVTTAVNLIATVGLTCRNQRLLDSYHSRERPPSSHLYQQQKILRRSSFLIDLHASSGVRLFEPRRKEWQQAEPIEDLKGSHQPISVVEGRDKRSLSSTPLKPFHQGVLVVLLYSWIVLSLTRHCKCHSPLQHILFISSISPVDAETHLIFI